MFAIALLASGQSSTITGTYAGQYVMQVGVYSMLMQHIQSRTLKISVYLAIKFPLSEIVGIFATEIFSMD